MTVYAKYFLTRDILFDSAIKHEHVQLIISGSSVMAVFSYLENESYLSLAKSIQPKQEFKKITIDDPLILHI